MKSTKKIIIILSILTTTWLILSVYAVRSQNNVRYGHYIYAHKLSEKPSNYWVLTNSSVIESLIISAVTHPDAEFYVHDYLDWAQEESMSKYLPYVEYEGEYFFVESVFVDPPPPPSILIGPAPILGFCWFFVGLKAWQQKKPSSN